MMKSKTTLEEVVKGLDIKKPDPQFICRYCQKAFVREQSLAVHLCEQKKRHQDQTEPGIRLAFNAFRKFYESTQHSATPKTFADFAKSSYYAAFAKFGRYMVSIHAINPAAFSDWVLKQNKKIDQWCSDRVYGEYLIYYLYHEAVSDALERAIKKAIQWSEENDAPFSDMLRYGNTNANCFAISTGKLSPWVLYSSDSGQAFLDSLTPDQIKIIWDVIDPDKWAKKLSSNAADWDYAKTILKAAGW